MKEPKSIRVFGKTLKAETDSSGVQESRWLWICPQDKKSWIRVVCSKHISSGRYYTCMVQLSGVTLTMALDRYKTKARKRAIKEASNWAKKAASALPVWVQFL